MTQLIRKILSITLAVLLSVNIAAGAIDFVGHCPSSMGSNSVVDMNHCDGMLNFVFPGMGCCGECNDIFCDLMKNPLQHSNVDNRSLFRGSGCPFYLVMLDRIVESGACMALSEPSYLFPVSLSWRLIPLYIEHLSLII